MVVLVHSGGLSHRRALAALVVLEPPRRMIQSDATVAVLAVERPPHTLRHINQCYELCCAARPQWHSKLTCSVLMAPCTAAVLQRSSIVTATIHPSIEQQLLPMALSSTSSHLPFKIEICSYTLQPAAPTHNSQSICSVSDSSAARPSLAHHVTPPQQDNLTPLTRIESFVY
jgi:hypothetical protein